MKKFFSKKMQNYFLSVLYIMDALAFCIHSRLLIYFLTGIILFFQTFKLLKIVNNSPEKNSSREEESRFSSYVYVTAMFLFAIAILIYAYE